MSIFNGFFDNLSKGITNPKGNLGDFQHAARLYTDNNMRLAPKFKHLYHVVLNISPYALRLSPLISENLVRKEINLLCHSADLPQFSLQTQTLNQYNRKKIIHTGIEYRPLRMQYHDDNAGLTSLLWESYYRYYYADGSYTTRNPDGSPSVSPREYQKAGNLNTMYASEGFTRTKFGLDVPGKAQNFFTSIQVFQLHAQSGRSTYTGYTLVNPYIESFEHDNVTQEGTEIAKTSLMVAYETVLYNRGYTSEDSVPPGFADVHYDHTPSPLSIGGGGTATLFGDGGVIAGAANSLNDFANRNVLSGLIKATNVMRNAGGLSKAGVVEEIANSATQGFRGYVIPSLVNKE